MRRLISGLRRAESNGCEQDPDHMETMTATEVEEAENAVAITLAHADAEIEERLAEQTGEFVLEDADKRFLLRACRIALEGYFAGKKVDASQFADVPESVRGQDPKLFVTLYRDEQPRGCRSSQDGDMLSSVLSATVKAIREDRLGGKLQRSELADTHIDITVLLDAEPVDQTDGSLGRQVELGVHSLSVQQDDKRAFFKSSVPINKNFTLTQTLSRLSRKAGLESRAYKSGDTEINRYPTVQFAEDFSDRFSDPGLVDFYRGVPLVRHADVDRGSLERSLRLASRYLANHATPKGRLTYEYLPTSGERIHSNKAVSVVRRTATTWLMADLALYLNDERLRRAAKRALGYILASHYQVDEETGFGYLLVKDNANVGSSGFALAALVALDDPEIHPTATQELAEFLLAMEDREGGFLSPTYLPERSHDPTDSKHHYYPGEAMTALMRLHEATGEDRYRDPVARVFPFYRSFFRASETPVNMAAWMSKPYAALFRAGEDREHADFVFEVNDLMVSKQYGLDELYIDRIGGFSKIGRSCSSGVFLESIAEGLSVAKLVDDEQRIERYTHSLLLGMRFMLQSQYSPRAVAHHPHEAQTLGGFRTDFFDPSVRIDNVQHCCYAILNALRELDLPY